MNQCGMVFVKFHKRVDRFLAFFGVGWHYSHENRSPILNDCINTDPNVTLHMVQEVLSHWQSLRFPTFLELGSLFDLIILKPAISDNHQSLLQFKPCWSF